MDTYLDLSGTWICCLDEQDVGLNENWYLTTLTGHSINLPGTLAENSIGRRYEREEGLTKENVRCLRSEFQYCGVAWYQREVIFQEELKLNEIMIFFERVMLHSTVWVNEFPMGTNDSLSTPHIFQTNIENIKLKTIKITVRIDNRDLKQIGTYSSAYTDETQTIWNGILGKMVVSKTRTTAIEKYNISAVPNKRTGIFDIELSSKEMLGEYILSIKDKERTIQTYSNAPEQTESAYLIKAAIPLAEEIVLWNEFHPCCYEIELKVINVKGEVVVWDIKRTGFRQIRRVENHIQINGVRTFLRGNIDCCLYPLTGYPPMEKEMWYKVMGKTKEYGLNHIRFHSWCPPEAAYEVADELGIYLQIEGPMWLDNWMDIEVGSTPEQYWYLPEEAAKIIKKYSYHASFCIFSNGNELNGDFKLLEDIIVRTKSMNPYLLYTLTTNWDRKTNPQDDLFISQSVEDIGIRGQYFLEDMVNTISLNFDAGVAKRDVPVISHEVGQYVVYPNINEIAKYKGVLKPVNFETIKEDLEKKKLQKYVPDFISTSGRLAFELYKAEFEAALSTNDLAGIQILSLHDFPGQSTATVGLLDVFFDEKGITDKKEFTRFCNSRVLLLQMEKKVFTTEETIKASLSISNYRETECTDVTVKITVRNQDARLLYTEELTIKHLDIGLNQIGAVLTDFDIAKLKGRQKLTIEAHIEEDKIDNEWILWIYEQCRDQKLLCETWSREIIDKLEAGENVILTPRPQEIRELSAAKYFPVFWSPVHFISKDPCGMMVSSRHPLFSKYYKSDQNADYEWKAFLDHAYAVNLDLLEDYDPMTMMVPNFYHNHKGSPLFELKAGNGKLLVCCFDFANNPTMPQTVYLKNAISEYVNSKDFNPDFQISISDLNKLFCTENETKDDRKDLAIGKKAMADSEQSEANAASMGNDGNPISCWKAADQQKGHYWQVDLENRYHIAGTKVVFSEKGRYLYVIQVSLDGVDWNVAINRTGTVEDVEYSVDEFESDARYIRIVYQDMSDGIMAGHKAFSVYE